MYNCILSLQFKHVKLEMMTVIDCKSVMYCRSTDWLPILNTLKINRTLEFIAIRSYFQQRVDDAGKC
jgi:hypothetical protein